jgi:hypothetical protein
VIIDQKAFEDVKECRIVDREIAGFVTIDFIEEELGLVFVLERKRRLYGFENNCAAFLEIPLSKLEGFDVDIEGVHGIGLLVARELGGSIYEDGVELSVKQLHRDLGAHWLLHETTDHHHIVAAGARAVQEVVADD